MQMGLLTFTLNQPIHRFVEEFCLGTYVQYNYSIVIGKNAVLIRPHSAFGSTVYNLFISMNYFPVTVFICVSFIVQLLLLNVLFVFYLFTLFC